MKVLFYFRETLEVCLNEGNFYWENIILIWNLQFHFDRHGEVHIQKYSSHLLCVIYKICKMLLGPFTNIYKVIDIVQGGKMKMILAQLFLLY